jgi:SAM-dependent methyltransferase
MTEIPDQAKRYWQYEYDVSTRYMVPLLKEWGVLLPGRSILDVGCGEGGGVCSFHDAGAHCVGFDIEQGRVDVAMQLQGSRHIAFAVGNVYEERVPFQEQTYDIVVLHDVFEHLEEKERMIDTLQRFMQPQGVMMITFPPYYSAFGAHQQLCSAPFVRLPFFHLIPFGISHLLPTLNNEHPATVAEVQKLSRWKMGMRKFERIARNGGLQIVRKRAYLIGPNHVRFGLRPVSAGILAKIPVLGELLCNGVVYLLTRE